MQVILKKDVQNLGEAGAVVNVKDGYARNFLFPKNVAELATKGALQNREQNLARIKAKQEKLLQQTMLLQAGLQQSLVLRLHLSQWQAQRSGCIAQLAHSYLDRNRIYLAEEGANQVNQLQLQLSRGLTLAVKIQLADVMGHLRCHIRKDRDYTIAAQGQDWHNLVIVARIYSQAITAGMSDLSNSTEVAAGFLHSYNVRMLCQLHKGRHLDIHTSSGWNIIQDNWNINCIRI